MGWHFLIVDDEPIERLALKKLISNHIEGVRICGEAGTGREAFEYVNRDVPDVILMDIQMPGMNGIEAVRKIKTAHQGVHFIMISAYDTFQFAQQVMREGVKEYLLKPSKKKDIIETIYRVLKQIEEERQSEMERNVLEEKYQKALAYIQSDWVTSLLQDHVPFVDSASLLRESHGEFSSVYALVIQINAIERLTEREKENWFQQLQRLIKDKANGLLGPMMGRQIPVLLPSIEDRHAESDQHQGVMMARAILRSANKNWELRMGIGHYVPKVEDFPLSYQQALTALDRTSANVPYLYYSRNLENQLKTGRLIEREKELIEDLRSGKMADSFEDYFTECVKEVGNDVIRIRERLMETRIILERLLMENGLRLQLPKIFAEGESVYQIRENAKVYFTAVARQIIAWRKETMGGTIDDAKHYMANHYKDALTLEDVSAAVGLSPYYFSKLYKEKEGMTFIEGLTSLRIEEAKRLLAETALSLKEICFEIGYHDPNYFSRVFKKMTGKSPSDFRREQQMI